MRVYVYMFIEVEVYYVYRCAGGMFWLGAYLVVVPERYYMEWWYFIIWNHYSRKQSLVGLIGAETFGEHLSYPSDLHLLICD